MERRLAFERAVDAYDRIRPRYPSEMFDLVFDALSPDPTIVEVGAGTGKATGDLLARGASVVAVEPGPEMRRRLRANLPSPSLTIVGEDFESAPIAAGRADAVFSASAYHWIETAAKTERPAELLRAGGLVAIVDLVQVASEVDRGFFSAAQPTYERYGEGHEGPPAPARDRVDRPIRRLLAADLRYRDVVTRCWDWDQRYTADEYIELMRSYSGTQTMEPDARAGLLRDMHAFITTRFDGWVTRPLVVACTTAHLVG